jgi:hypothetical protein
VKDCGQLNLQTSLQAIFIWCRNLKDKVFTSNPHILEELKNNIREEIPKILKAELQQVNQNVLSH